MIISKIQHAKAMFEVETNESPNCLYLGKKEMSNLQDVMAGAAYHGIENLGDRLFRARYDGMFIFIVDAASHLNVAR